VHDGFSEITVSTDNYYAEALMAAKEDRDKGSSTSGSQSESRSSQDSTKSGEKTSTGNQSFLDRVSEILGKPSTHGHGLTNPLDKG
jgi:hypothetical protein